MTPEQLAHVVRGCLPGKIPAGTHVEVLRRRGPGPGTWTTPAAVRLAGRGADPHPLAAALAARLRAHPAVADAQVIEGGHVTLTPDAARATTTALAVGRVRPDTLPAPDLAGVADDLVGLRAEVLGRCRERLRRVRPRVAPAGLAHAAGPVQVVPRPRVAPTAREVVHRLGSDAVAHALLRVRPGAAAELDLRPRPGEAVVAVQHAHARVARAVRTGAALGRRSDGGAPLDGPGEPALLAAVADHARVVDAAAGTGDPHRLVHHLDDLAALVHAWADACPWPGGDPAVDDQTDLDVSRLGLALSLRAVLAEGLGLLGATAPERV